MAIPATSEADRSEMTADVVPSESQPSKSSSLRERSAVIYGASEPQAPTGKERLELDMNLASMLVSATLEGDEEAPLLKIMRLGSMIPSLSLGSGHDHSSSFLPSNQTLNGFY